MHTYVLYVQKSHELINMLKQFNLIFKYAMKLFNRQIVGF